MRVLIVAEGPHERGRDGQPGALEILVRRLQPLVDECDVDRVSRNDVHAHHGKGKGYFKKALRWMLEARKRGYEALVLLIDEDNYPERVQEITDAQAYSCVDMRRALGVAIRTFDAWILADERALTAVLGYDIPRQRKLEDLSAPKAACRRLLDESRHDMPPTEMYSKVMAEADVETLEKRCPKGFAPFAGRVRNL